MIKHVTGILCLVILVIGLANSQHTYGKTLYVVRHSSGAGEGNLYAFDMNADELVFQAQTSVTEHGCGAIDLAIDNSYDTLFISFEDCSGGGNILELVNSKSLESMGSITLSGPSNLTGIVFDTTRSRLYGTDRNTNELYAYTWNALSETITPDPCNPIELDNIDYACGLAIDGDVLYVSEYDYEGLPTYDEVQMYDIANDWQYLGSKDMGNYVVGIDYDSTDDILYGGAYDYNGTYHHLIKHSTDPNSIIEKDIGTNATAVAVDESTGLVYVTTYRYDSGSQDYGSVEIYDTSGWTSDPCQVISPEFVYQSSSGDGITIANLAGLAIGGPYKSRDTISISKTDDLDPNTATCYEPDDYIVYTITIGPNGHDHLNLTVRDWLPYGITYVSSDPNYDYIDWMVYYDGAMVWELGELGAEDPNIEITITGRINDMAEPLSEIENTVYVESDVAYSWASEFTPICCWGGDIIYVDAASQGVQTGVSWADSYVDLQRALSRARLGCGDEIWVAGGIYTPGTSAADDYAIPSGVEVYGGFQGNETERSQRDSDSYPTILSGEYTCTNVVAATNSDGTTVLDGFTIEHASDDGVYLTDSDIVINDCVIADNNGCGIYGSGAPTITKCVIADNAEEGVEFQGSDQPLLTHCTIANSGGVGIDAGNAAVTIANSFITNSGASGIWMASPSQSPTVHNVTITHSGGYGINKNSGAAADIYNCILWANNSQGNTYQFNGCNLDYSCYYDPNAPQGSSTPDANGNITCDPCFVYDDPNNCHLRSSSACVDLGYNYTGSDTDTDLDGDVRLFDGDNDFIDEIDMGCDEVDCNDIEHEWDFNEDGIINMAEFRVFAAAWGIDSSDPNWTLDVAQCDFYADNVIDWLDLAELADEWLWQACWLDSDTYGMMMAMGGGNGMMPMMMGGELMLATAESAAIESATSTTTAHDELDAIRFARWYVLSGIEPTLTERIYTLEAIIFWMESIPSEYPDLWDEFDQDDWYEFLDGLREELEDLWAEYLQQ